MSLLQMMMAGLSLEYEGVITSGDLHIATKDGEAMFFHDSIDFSAYAGNDAGLTPYRFVFIDSAGKIATAYGGAAGGGEALGSESVTNGDFSLWTGDNPDGWDVFFEDASNYITQDVGGARIVSNGTTYLLMQQTVSQVEKSLYKALWSASVTAGGYTVGLAVSGRGWDSAGRYITEDAIHYYTHIGFASSLRFARVGTCDVIISDVSFKKLTDVPATGLHLMSTKNGTTRNMASVEAGFDPNAIVGVKIYG